MPDVRDFLMPDLGEGLTEGEIVEWLVAEGDTVAVDQPIAEMSTDKATVQVPTPFAGRVVTLHGAPGDTVRVRSPLISIDVAGDGQQASETPPEGSGNVLVGYGTGAADAAVSRRRRVTPGAPSTGGATAGGAPAASPLVRRQAAERGIDIATITGTGPGGMVTSADLDRASVGEQSASTSATPATAGARHRLTGVDRVAAERLARSHREAPVATAWLSADATALLELRAALEQRHPDVRVTPFAILLRLCVVALQRFPRLNAHFDAGTNEVITFEPIHLGVAVQTDRGLVVPVIRDAQTLTLARIAAELDALAGRARRGELDATEMTGSTFTVSNFGAFGVDGGTAIVNPPEAAILGVGQITERPWVVDGAVVARQVVELSLVFDHRVADGAVGGGFIRQLADLVEQPGAAAGDD